MYLEESLRLRNKLIIAIRFDLCISLLEKNISLRTKKTTKTLERITRRRKFCLVVKAKNLLNKKLTVKFFRSKGQWLNRPKGL